MGSVFCVQDYVLFVNEETKFIHRQLYLFITLSTVYLRKLSQTIQLTVLKGITFLLRNS